MTPRRRGRARVPAPSITNSQYCHERGGYNALTVARDEGFVNTGDIVIITAGDPQTSPRQGDYTTSTNMCMVAQVQ